MNCNFSEDVQRDITPMRIEAQEIQQRDSFPYLGSIISKEGEVEVDVKQGIREGLLKWRLGLGALCDQRIPTRFK